MADPYAGLSDEEAYQKYVSQGQSDPYAGLSDDEAYQKYQSQNGNASINTPSDTSPFLNPNPAVSDTGWVDLSDWAPPGGDSGTFSRENLIDVPRSKSPAASLPEKAPTFLNEQSPAESLAGGMGNILDGMTLGFGDEIIGGGTGALDFGQSVLQNGWDNTPPLMDMIRSREAQSEGARRQFTDENPVTGTLGELSGMLNNPLQAGQKAIAFGKVGPITKASGWLGRIGQETGLGAAQGGVMGLGSNDNQSLSDYLENTAVGAGVGGAAGTIGSTLSEGLTPWRNAGKRLQRSAIGIRQSDLAKAAKDVPRGAPNPMIESFDQLQSEGVFAGSKNPIRIQEKLDERAMNLNNELKPLLDRVSQASGITVPPLRSTANLLDPLKGTDYIEARQILTEEVDGLIQTLDNGGTIEDWQAAKRSLQGNSRYGSDSADLRNRIRKSIASDIRQHIEDTADAAAKGGAIPAADAGQVKALNKSLSQGLRMGEVARRNEIQDAARDPEKWIRSMFRTSGGFGVPALITYNKTGSVKDAVGAGVAGALTTTRMGKYIIGDLIKRSADAPMVLTKAGSPFFIRQEIKNKDITPGQVTADDAVRAGGVGVQQFKAGGGDPEELYKSAIYNLRNFAAPHGILDQTKFKKWTDNNKSMLEQLPELKAQLSNPQNAQAVVSRHFGAAESLPRDQVELEALKEMTSLDPQNVVDKMLSSGKSPIENIRQITNYLRKDKEALTGLRRAVLDTFDASGGPESYIANREALQKGGLFTDSQIKMADSFYNTQTQDPKANESSLRALVGMARGDYLQTAPTTPYLSAVGPVIKSIPPDVIKSRLRDAILDPSLSRDLMTKSTAHNVTRNAEALFGKEITDALGSAPAPREKVTASPRVEATLSKSSFPKPSAIQRPAEGMLQKTSFQLDKLDKETQARIAVESSGNPDAVSPKGAQGLSQLMPATGAEMALKRGVPYTPVRPGMSPEERQAAIEQNIQLGKDYFDQLLYDEEINPSHSRTLARAAYNAGPDRIRKAEQRVESTTDVQAILNALPSGVKRETLPYVRRLAQRYA